MKAGGRVAVLIFSVAALALPAVAEAKAQPEVHPGSFRLEVSLPPSDGWWMSIVAEDHRHIALTAARGARSLTYRVLGRASTRRLKANFGRFGSVDIELDLAVEPPGLLPGRTGERCRGGGIIELSGRFHGSVDFDGGDGGPGVSARMGQADVARRLRKVCRGPKKQPLDSGENAEPELPIAINLLGARAHGDGRTTSFEALGLELAGETLFGVVSGSVHERLSRIRVIRSATELVEGPMLTVAPRGGRSEWVKVLPPQPFTGRASYLKKGGGPSTWTGDLAVRLPGAGNVPLSGPEFDARLCQAEGIEALDGLKSCLLEIRALRAPHFPMQLLRHLYGSGSHSQPLAVARLSSLR